ncbi:hypothetical protein [Aliamphritea spongicola]|uniref:hypothetical protein n=1 Tax=Aliamphritea spongicola TaxID=707589 RepID=UPI00196AE5D6|nr:hypothetical protein [Aliamphritea spongicola]MBN3561845.1 hypothetical protein [Aliamphritea spongicola]
MTDSSGVKDIPEISARAETKAKEADNCRKQKSNKYSSLNESCLNEQEAQNPKRSGYQDDNLLQGSEKACQVYGEHRSMTDSSRVKDIPEISASAEPKAKEADTCREQTNTLL